MDENNQPLDTVLPKVNKFNILTVDITSGVKVAAVPSATQG